METRRTHGDAEMNDMQKPGTVAVDVVSVDAMLDRGGNPLVGVGLHPAVAERITAGARRLSRHGALRIRLTVPQEDLERTEEVREAIARHFGREARDAEHELHEIFHNGRVAAVVGLVFVSVLLGIGQAVAKLSGGYMATAVTESMTVFAWVAMWRPAELLLYEHWPVRRRRRLSVRLARAAVALRPRP